MDTVTPPALSVIIPTFNRAPTLAKCLHALRAQACPSAQFEMVVADDGSSDDTAAVVAAMAAQDGAAIRYVRQENAGANRARNRAIDVARAELLLFINDDTIATKDLVALHLGAHARHPEAQVAVLGRVTVAPELPHSRLAPLHLDRAFVALGSGREFDWRAFFTCNISVKRALLEMGGRFEERLRYHEDLELALRLSEHGLRVIYVPGALGYHDHFLGEQEFFAIAGREARSLIAWAAIAPSRRPQLAVLGYEPALPTRVRLRHQLYRLVVNRATRPFWLAVARHAPNSLEHLSVRVYDQLYQSEKRAVLRQEIAKVKKQ